MYIPWTCASTEQRNNFSTLKLKTFEYSLLAVLDKYIKTEQTVFLLFFFNFYIFTKKVHLFLFFILCLCDFPGRLFRLACKTHVLHRHIRNAHFHLSYEMSAKPILLEHEQLWTGFKTNIKTRQLHLLSKTGSDFVSLQVFKIRGN